MQGEINPEKAYMWGYRAIVNRVESLIRERERLERGLDRVDSAWQRATRATSRMTATRISGTGDHDSMANAVLDIIRYKGDAASSAASLGKLGERINREIDAAADALAVRLSMIDRLSDERYKAVMVMRYVEGMDWERVCHALHYESRWVFVLHGKALEEIRRMMFERVQ